MIGRLLLTMAFVAGVSVSAISQTLPATAQNFIAKNYPDWTIGESWLADRPRIPAIISGDFNGDRTKDHAVLLKKDERTYLIVLLGKRNGFDAVNVLALGPDQVWVAGIARIPKGKTIEINDGKDKFRPTRDAFEAYDQEGRSSIFHWEKGTFRRIENTY